MQKLLFLTCTLMVLLTGQVLATSPSLVPAITASQSENQLFRDSVMQYVQYIAEKEVQGQPPLASASALVEQWGSNYAKAYWSVHLTIYDAGQAIAHGDATAHYLAAALRDVTRSALAQVPQNSLNLSKLRQFTFVITFDYPPYRYYSFVNYQAQALELLGNRLALRRLSKENIRRQIDASEHFLLHIMHPEHHAFMQVYDAENDKKDSKLRTIYSASALYTLLKIQQYSPRPDLEKQFQPIVDFLLSMQLQEGENRGAFYYAVDALSGEKECRVETGTASKTIFTLLNLYALQGNTRDLQAAQNAGDWLVTKIKADGQVTHTGRCQQGTWQYSTKQSFLYAGQMLSALSRLYSVTKHPAYYQGATKIAQRLLAQVEKQQAFVGDDFRAPNTISTSWATLALMDYAKINPAPVYRQRMEQTADALLARQMTNQQDVYNYGRYWDTMTSSGNGWINEVMGELYPFCVQQNMSHCGRYREAMILTTRWLMQNAYTAANSYNIPNPQQAIGGFIRNYIDHSVRIDAVCHGVNSLLSLMQITSDQPEVLVDLAEEPLDARIGLLRIGKI